MEKKPSSMFRLHGPRCKVAVIACVPLAKRSNDWGEPAVSYR